jgi:hypothetical protein
MREAEKNFLRRWPMDLQKKWQELLPLYLRCVHNVDPDTLHDAILHAVETYDATKGITLKSWFWKCYKGWRDRQRLYAARRGRKVVSMEDVENLPDSTERKFEVAEASAGVKFLMERLNDEYVKKVVQRSLHGGNEVPDGLARIVKKRLGIDFTPVIGPLFDRTHPSAGPADPGGK